MGKLGSELRWWDQTSSSTILLDPAALIERCKRQIQGKDGISAEQQRLIFACRVDNQEILSYTCKGRTTSPKAEACAASEFLKELGSWKAILKDENNAIAKLLHPRVAPEEQISAEDGKVASSLSSHTARELRALGIPCNVYYLFFNKWMPTSLKSSKGCKASSDLNIQIDANFQASSFQVLLFGRLNGSNFPRPFIYRLDGGEVVAKVSMLEQTLSEMLAKAQYRHGQKTRHPLGLSSRSGSKVAEVRDGRTIGENVESAFNSRSERVADYYCPCGKDLEFTLIISGDHQLKCFVLTVIQVPASASRKAEEQLVANVHGGCERGIPSSLHNPAVYRAPPSDASSFKSESSSTTCEDEVENTQSLGASCDLADEASFLPASCGPSCSSSSLSVSEGMKSPYNWDLNSQHMPGIVKTSSGMEGLIVLEEAIGKLPKTKKRRKGKRSGRLRRGKGSNVAVAEDGDCFPPTLPAAALQSSSPPSKAERNNDLYDISSCLVIGPNKPAILNTLDSPISKEILPGLQLTDEKRKNEKEEVCRCEYLFSRSITEDSHSSTMAQRKKYGSESALKGSSFLESSSEGSSCRKIIALSEEIEEENSSWRSVLSNVEDDHLLGGEGGDRLLVQLSLGSSEVLTEPREPCGSRSPLGPPTRPCTSNSSSQCNGSGSPSTSQSCPCVDALLVNVGRQDSVPQSSSSGGCKGGSEHDPLKEWEREAPKDLEADKDMKDHFRLPDGNFSARGGHNNSGAGSKNGRSGTGDGGGSRRHGKDSEERKESSGYSGGGQGSSGSNHGSRPGGGSGSTSSGSGDGGDEGGGGGGGGAGSGGSGSGGSGRGNENGKGGCGNSGGGSWERCHVDDDGGNGNGEGDKDGKRGPSFQAGTKGESGADSSPVLRQKGGVGPLDYHSEHEQKSLTGTATQHAGPLANGSRSGHGSLGIPVGRANEIANCYRNIKVADIGMADPETLRRVSVGHSHFATGSLSDPGPRVCPYSKSFSTALFQLNGFLLRDDVPAKEDLASEKVTTVGNHPLQGGANAIRDSSTKVLTQNMNDPPKNDRLSGSNSWGSKDGSQMPVTVPAQDSSLEGSWQKISIVPEVAAASSSSAVLQTAGNGTQISGFSDSDVATHARSFSGCISDPWQESISKYSRHGDSITRLAEGEINQPGVTRSEHLAQAAAQIIGAVPTKPLGERSLQSEESVQRPTGRRIKRPLGEQEWPLVISRDKSVTDGNRGMQGSQKWVPVDHRSGGFTNIFGSQFELPRHVTVHTGWMPIDGNVVQKDFHKDSVKSEDMVTCEDDGVYKRVEGHSSLRDEFFSRLQIPFGSSQTTSAVFGAYAESPMQKDSADSVCMKRLSGNVEHSNLQNRLPREKGVDSKSAQAILSTVTDNCLSERPSVPGVKEGYGSSDGDSEKDSNVAANVMVMSSAEEETRRAAMEVLDAVRVSCECQRAAQNFVFEVGHPVAEFEKVLGAVSPSFCSPATGSGPSSGLLNWNSHSDRKGDTNFYGDSTFTRNCMANGLSGLPLSSIWQWYEEPSHYGAEVRAIDRKNGYEEDFLAYFVPYISALQLFGYSLQAGTKDSDSVVSTEGKTEWRMACQPKILSNLLPKPRKSDESSSPFRTKWLTTEQTDSDCKDTRHSELQLIYEFYDSDPPQVRQPLFMKMEELLKGASNSRGDPTVMEGLRLGDIHPASWFAVAWYPIYRISEGPLRAVFLAYHSFNHFAPRSSLFSLTGKPPASDDTCVSLPVVGLECYNVQGESWFSMRGDFSKAVIEERTTSLEEAAAVMARGIPYGKPALSADGSQSYTFRHPDHQFFVKRRPVIRQVLESGAF